MYFIISCFRNNGKEGYNMEVIMLSKRRITKYPFVMRRIFTRINLIRILGSRRRPWIITIIISMSSSGPYGPGKPKYS